MGDESDLVERLKGDGKLKLIRSTLFHGAARAWELLYAPQSFELGLIDSMVWAANVRAATKGEQETVSDSVADAGESGDPVLDAVQSGLDFVEGAKEEASRTLMGMAVAFGLIGGVVYLVFRRR